MYGLNQPLNCPFGVLSELTFPSCENPPASLLQSLLCLAIPFNRARKLPDPKWSIRSGRGGKAAPGMAMPVAAMDENNGAVLWEDDVRFTGERSDVLPKPQTCSVKERP